MTINYKVGDTVEVRGGFGAGPTYVTECVGKSDDIKNGRAGGDGANGHWWYDDQVVRVVKKG